MNCSEWLAIPEDKLGVALAKVLALEPWKHGKIVPEDYGFSSCGKCGEMLNTHGSKVYCSVPDPINIKSWEEAMKWRDKVVAGKDSTEFATCLLEVFGGGIEGDIDECFAKAQPRDYLRAVALAQEAKNE